MIVYHAYRLHEGITDDCAYKIKSTFLKVYTHSIGFGRMGGDFTESGWGSFGEQCFAVGEFPDIFVKRTELFLHFDKMPCVIDSRLDLTAIADNTGIAKKPVHIIGGK